MSTARTLATWFGCGLSPVAPGTVGSLGAVPLHLVLRLLPPGVHLGAVVAVAAAAVWSAEQVAREEGVDDPQIVVIDEVAGALIAMGLVRGRGIATEIAALVLFRVLDIWKPGPVAWAEKAKPTGLGIVLDDLVAGALAGIGARLVG